MTTKQQMKTQLDYLKEENARLEEQLRHQTASNPNTTPRRLAETEGARSRAVRELGAAREELARHQQQLAAVAQERDAARLEIDSLQQLVTSYQEALVETEELGRQIAEARREAEELETRAKRAESEAQRLTAELSRQQTEAELQQYRALAAQERKWESRERQTQEHLAEMQRRFERARGDNTSEDATWETRVREAREEAERACQEELTQLREQLEQLREQQEKNEDMKQRLLAELVDRSRRQESTAPIGESHVLSPQGRLSEIDRPDGDLLGALPSRGLEPTESRGRSRVAPRDPPPLIPVHSAGPARQQQPQAVPEDAWLAEFEAPNQAAQLSPTQQITEMLSNLSTQQLPTLPEFSGEEQSAAGTFSDWIERFEMMAELTQWNEGVKLKQMVLRLRGSAQAFYRTCSAEQKGNYRALVTEFSRRFTPVRIQALECSVFHERKQGSQEAVDAYAQDLQRLFQKAYPRATLRSDDAQEMGEAVLSSQFVGGLVPGIKRKVAYIEGATFSELWQKARYEEARLRDLSSHLKKDGIPYRRSKEQNRDTHHRGGDSLPQKHVPWSRYPEVYRQLGTHQERQVAKCYRCGQLGHYARSCPARRETERSEAKSRLDIGRGNRAAAVKPSGQGPEGKKIFEWMYGTRSAHAPSRN